MDWIRRTYHAAGLTQHPVGRHLSAVQAFFGGTVVLCLDVSGSMSGDRLVQGVAGSQEFVAEALAAHYTVGVVLWDDGVHAAIDPTRDDAALQRFLRGAQIAGGTNVIPALLRSEQMLAERTGDRVIAIFGDGDLGSPARAVEEANRLAGLGIRVITCGLGQASGEALNIISTETEQAPRVAEAGAIAQAISGMSSALRRT